eukprot:Pgem_evm1s3902
MLGFTNQVNIIGHNNSENSFIYSSNTENTVTKKVAIDNDNYSNTKRYDSNSNNNNSDSDNNTAIKQWRDELLKRSETSC